MNKHYRHKVHAATFYTWHIRLKLIERNKDRSILCWLPIWIEETIFQRCTYWSIRAIGVSRETVSTQHSQSYTCVKFLNFWMAWYMAWFKIMTSEMLVVFAAVAVVFIYALIHFTLFSFCWFAFHLWTIEQSNNSCNRIDEEIAATCHTLWSALAAEWIEIQF